MLLPRTIEDAIRRAQRQCRRMADSGRYRGVYVWRASDGRLHTTTALPRHCCLLLIVTDDDVVAMMDEVR